MPVVDVENGEDAKGLELVEHASLLRSNSRRLIHATMKPQGQEGGLAPLYLSEQRSTSRGRKHLTLR